MQSAIAGNSQIIRNVEHGKVDKLHGNCIQVSNLIVKICHSMPPNLLYLGLRASGVCSRAANRCVQAFKPLSHKSIMLDNLPDWLLIGEDGKPITKTRSAPADFLGAAVGITMAATEVATHHGVFTLSNLVACTIASDVLQLIGIRSFRTAAVLLIGAILLKLGSLQRAKGWPTQEHCPVSDLCIWRQIPSLCSISHLLWCPLCHMPSPAPVAYCALHITSMHFQAICATCQLKAQFLGCGPISKQEQH